MKLNDFTKQSLRNFATINRFMVLRPGNVQKVSSDRKDLIGKVILDQPIETDVEFPIFDLNMFLGAIQSLDDPSLEFKGEYVEISDDNFKLTYFSSFSGAGVAAPVKDLEVIPFIEFELAEDQFKRIQRLSGGLSLDFLEFVGTPGEGVFLRASSGSNDNVLEMKVLDNFDEENEFNQSIHIRNLLMVPDDYKVIIVQTPQFVSFQNDYRRYDVAVKIEEWA